LFDNRSPYVNLVGTSAPIAPSALPENPDPLHLEEVQMAPTGYTTKKLYDIATADIAQDPLQPRKYFAEDSMAELAKSIQNVGVLQPILVRAGSESEGKFIVVSGERRLQASIAAGLTTIPAIITDGNPMEVSIVENLLRENLTAIEEAEAIDSLRIAHSYQLTDLSQVLGKAESTLSAILSLNKLPDAVKNDCRNDPKTARSILVEIAKERTPTRMTALYQRYKASGLTRGEIRAREDKPKKQDAAIDLTFVGTCTKRLAAIEVEKLQQEQMLSLAADLDTLRLEVNRKLRKLKPEAQQSQ
jgi:ParB family transcriptional regulator, chromosome partitioning protein